jgi:hypothetical protein
MTIRNVTNSKPYITLEKKKNHNIVFCFMTQCSLVGVMFQKNMLPQFSGQKLPVDGNSIFLLKYLPTTVQIVMTQHTSI